MRLTALKPLRVAVSLITFFLVLFLFVDVTGRLTQKLVQGILFFQFVPSAVALFHLFSLTAMGWLFIIILTLFSGRVYCSFLCPLGTLQDFVTGIRTRWMRKKRLRFMKAQPWVQYTFLTLAVVPLLFGNLFFLNLLDPFSFAGKIFTNIVRPLVYSANNFLVWGLKQFNDYSVYPVEMKFVPIPSVLFAAVLFGGIVVLAFFKGRWYCNSFCPVGTGLGFLSRFSMFRIRISETDCTSCGACVKSCKAGCIDVKTKNVDFTRCVACYNCFRSCDAGGFSYKYSWKTKSQDEDSSRRTFLKQTAAGITGVAGLLATESVFAQEKPKEMIPKPGPATPPGSLSIWNYTSACTACHLCISACPTRVLQPSFLEYGIGGMFMPKMNYAASYCNFDCIVCSQVCPTEAIRPLTMEQKHRVQIGVSKLIKDICVVVEKKTACGACSEHCPTKAVEMVPYLGTLKIPEIDEKLCVGCGACEHACPTKPVRAIYVEPLKYHRFAMIPLRNVNAAPEIKKSGEDFPF